MTNNLRRLVRQLRKLWKSQVVFPSYSDALRYAALEKKTGPQEVYPVTLRIKALANQTVVCRSGTTDAAVLWSTFYEKYHLPDHSLRDSPCILDLGANVGYTTAHFAALYPKCRVVGVEMDQDNFDIARQNTQRFAARCEMIHAAVSSVDGELAYLGEREDGFHLVSPGTPASEKSKFVCSLTMTSLMRQFRVDTVDFVKMDIEGAEREVFTGDLGWLRAVQSLKIEIHRPEDFAVIGAALKSYGFDWVKDTHHWSTVIAKRSGTPMVEFSASPTSESCKT